jgi:hypothetical protein
MPIQRTSTDVLAQAPTVLARLNRALTGVERGDAGAGGDLATVIRLLLDTGNRGNKFLGRVAAALSVSLPPVFVTGGPTTDPSGGLFFSFGNLPADSLGNAPAVPASMPDAVPVPDSRQLAFDQWMDAVSLVAPRTQKKQQSWRQFVTLIANTGGAHFGTDYHDILERSDLFGAVGMSLQDYLLRQIGWQAERVLADFVVKSGHPLLPRTRRIDFLPRTPIWMDLRDSTGTGVRAAVAVNVTSDIAAEVEVIRFELRGRTHHLFHNGGAPSNVKVRFVIDDPVAGTSTTVDGGSE